MKFVLVIDHLGSGGAQRQLCWLARVLRDSGVQVDVVVYYPHDFFIDFLNQDGDIAVHLIKWRGQLQRFFRLKEKIRELSPDVVVSFLEVPSFLCALGGLFRRRYVMIASERNHDVNGLSWRVRMRLFMHRFVDAVVANSHVQADFICRARPHLASKIHVITNMVDLEHFNVVDRLRGGEILVVGVGRLVPQKNLIGLIDAVASLDLDLEISNLRIVWYGNDPDPSSGYATKMYSKIRQYGLTNVVQIRPATKDIRSCFSEASALCLPSVHEGCSNVIGEAMSSGLPIISSRAGDSEFLLDDGEVGILFDASDPESISEALRRFLGMSLNERRKMGDKSRARAEAILSKKRFLGDWSNLFEKVIGDKLIL